MGTARPWRRRPSLTKISCTRRKRFVLNLSFTKKTDIGSFSAWRSCDLTRGGNFAHDSARTPCQFLEEGPARAKYHSVAGAMVLCFEHSSRSESHAKPAPPAPEEFYEGDPMTFPRCHALLESGVVGIIIIVAGVLPLAAAQGAGRELPVVTFAATPLYPRTALLGSILGAVRIRVTTDGRKVSSLNVESGPPMLARAAEENIQTWQFERHEPTTFVVTFQYRIKDPPACQVGNSTVLMHMPLSVEISARGVYTCDPRAQLPSKRTH